MMRRKFWYAVLACYLLLLGFLSLNPWVRPVSTNEILSPDKLEHALAYGGMSIIVFFCLASSRSGYWCDTLRAWVVALSVSMLIGILVEIVQSLFTSNRTGSVEDAVANAIGAVLGYVFYYAVKYVYARTAIKI